MRNTVYSILIILFFPQRFFCLFWCAEWQAPVSQQGGPWDIPSSTPIMSAALQAAKEAKSHRHARKISALPVQQVFATPSDADMPVQVAIKLYPVTPGES